MSATCLNTHLLLAAFLFFFFNDTSTTEIYTLSLHDALPIYHEIEILEEFIRDAVDVLKREGRLAIITFHSLEDRVVKQTDRKSTRLNSSHRCISYAVFCLKKKKKTESTHLLTQ